VLVQGIVEIIRCSSASAGEWPLREADVQEVDVEKLKEMGHVKTRISRSSISFVVQQERHK